MSAPNRSLKVAYITAGAAGMYCGTCLHDNTLVSAMIDQGNDVVLLPTYTPTRTDEHNVSEQRIFFGALNVYLQQKAPFFRKIKFLDRLLDNRFLLALVGKMAGKASTDAADLGALTLSMLEGEAGHQAKELDKLIDFLEQHLQPDIVHLSFTLFAGFARRIKERLGVPVVCSLQGEDLFFEDLVEPWKSRVLAEVAARSAEIDAFTAPNSYYAELMSRDYGVPKERIFPARLGIDASDFEHLEPSSNRSPNTSPVIGYLARQCPEKGLHSLVDAFILLSATHTGARLRIAGFLGPKDEVFVEAQKAKVDAAGLGERVDWLGEVDRAEKVHFLAGLDVFTVPTVYHESKGLFVPEALAAGVPVVLPDHGSFPEWLERTGGGVLVEPDSAPALATALLDMLGNDQLRWRLGTMGRERVLQDFNRQVMAQEMIDLYHRVVSGDLRTSAA